MPERNVTGEDQFDYGDLNEVSSPSIRREFDPKDDSFLGVTADAALREFQTDSLSNTGPYKAIVLRVEENSLLVDVSSFLGSIFGDKKPPKLLRVKARIPELHSVLPIPKTLDKDDLFQQKIVDMYPTFTAKSSDFNSPVPEVGNIVWVDFGNKGNMTDPFYLGTLDDESHSSISQKNLSKGSETKKSFEEGRRKENQQKFAAVGDGVGTVLLDQPLDIISDTCLANAATYSEDGLHYCYNPEKPFGRKWGNKRPPGLPVGIRPAGTPNSAIPLIRSFGKRTENGPVFVSVLENIALGETRATIGLPANIYNTLPPSRRGGARLITAWGVFSWNRLALAAILKRYKWKTQSGSTMPQDLTLREEVEIPIRLYSILWKQAKDAGVNDLTAARYLRYWHKTPGAARRWAANGFKNWGSVSSNTRIDHHLLYSSRAIPELTTATA